jgi:hypothetical protein
MSDREKKLVLLFSLAAFVLLNVFGVSWFRSYKKDVAAKLSKAESKLQVAQAYSDSYTTVADEMDWLADHLPKARAEQIVQTELEQFASNQASNFKLTVNRKKILPSDVTPGRRFHRAKVEYNVTGSDFPIYQWLDQLQMPNQLRAITFLKLSPNGKDDTLMDCNVTAEQWFIPPGGDNDAGSAATPSPAPDGADDAVQPPPTPEAPLPGADGAAAPVEPTPDPTPDSNPEEQ